jgi:hypothetical protein
MGNYLWGGVILAGCVVWQTAVIQADDELSPRPDLMPAPVTANWPDGGRQQAEALQARSDRGWAPAVGQPVSSVPQPLQGPPPSAPPVDGPRPAGWPARPEVAGSWQVPRRLPPTGPTISADPILSGFGVAPSLPANPAGRGENRLFPDTPQAQPVEFRPPAPLSGEGCEPLRGQLGRGAVYGRLLNKGRFLVNCRVALVPMHREEGVYCLDPDRNVLSTTTGQDGVYYFADAAAGEYKLTWLPAGQTRWIRRIAMRPDIEVRTGETTTAKEIRVALQTIN